MALGEQLVADEHGRLMSARVLPPEGAGLNRIELTFQSAGTILGTRYANTGTVLHTATPAGTLTSVGHGLAVTQDGEPLSWTFQGIGTPTGANFAGKFRGLLLFQTPSQKLARLNTLCAVLEAESDEQQNLSVRFWEWS